MKLLEALGLVYDFRVPYYHLKEGAELAKLFSGLQFVVNHAGLPRDRSSEGLAIWRDGMKALATHPNVAIKVSGLSLPGMPWTVETQGGVILETIDIFGIDRCMFASNFPPDNCVTEFAPMMEGYQDVMAKFTQDERDRFFYVNAERYYQPVPWATLARDGRGRSVGRGNRSAPTTSRSADASPSSSLRFRSHLNKRRETSNSSSSHPMPTMGALVGATSASRSMRPF